MDTPSEHGVYSLELKQRLLDKMTAKQNKNREPKEVARVENNISETDSSNGLSSRLDRVKITGEVEDLVNGNSRSKTDDNGNRQPRQTKNNIREKTIIVKDKTSSNKNVEKKENDKNRSKVLTQGDKLNIIKATRHLTSGDRAETETGGDKQDKPERREKKITDYHRQTKVNSRVTRPNILTKRETVTSRYDKCITNALSSRMQRANYVVSRPVFNINAFFVTNINYAIEYFQQINIEAALIT